MNPIEQINQRARENYERIHKMNKTEKAYKEIMEVLKKHEQNTVFDVNRLGVESRLHLYGVKLAEDYGFNLDPKKVKTDGLGYYCFNENMHLTFIDGKRRTITCPDDGEQPNGETLLKISFPTGPYIFGEDYPSEFFQRFFWELKGYAPKYTDSSNKALYFSLGNAGKVFNDYDSIVKRYCEENKEDRKRREIEAMKKKIAEMEGTK